MERTGKNYEELTIIDDFMFGKVMRNPKHRRITGQKPLLSGSN